MSTLDVVQTDPRTLAADQAARSPFARPGSYDDACTAAATAQGLDPLAMLLTVAGVEYGIEQTGGFCMVLTVRTESHTYAVIQDGDGPRPWLLGAYLGDAWTECGESETDTQHTLDDLVALLKAATGRDQ